MHIRGALLVSGAVSQLDEPETVALIEPARLPIRLESPEVQFLRLFPNSRQKGQPYPAAVPSWVDIEMIEPILLQDGKSDQPALILRKPDRGGWKDVLPEERQILLRCVKLWQIREAGLAHVAVQPSDRVHICTGGAPKNEAAHYSAQTRVGGKIASTRVPSLGRLEICSAPRFASTSALVRGRPRPVPPRLREVAS
jgi:hypothetical protein